MNISPRGLLSSLLIVIGSLALVSPARAADTVISYQLPATDTAGIAAVGAPGIAACAGPCGTLRLSPNTAVTAKRQGMLIFSAPDGTSIVSASIRLRYRTKQQGVSVHLQRRVAGQWLDGQRLRSSGGTTTSVTTGAGASAVAVTLTADSAIPARAVKAEGENAVYVSRAQLTVRDVAIPTVAWTAGDPASGAWQRATVCGSYAARDVGLGVDRVEYAVGQTSAVVTTGTGTLLQPRPLSVEGGICIDTHSVGDGTFGTTLTAVDTGPAGNRSPAVSGLMRIDNTPPVVTFQPPADVEARLPSSQLAVMDATSGIDHITADIDGLPAVLRTVNGLTTVTPSSPLVDGTHRLAWLAADLAGNVSTGVELFGVADTTPPVIDAVQPLGPANATAVVTAHAADTGSGLSADGWRLAIDGVDVTGAATIDTNGLITFTPTRSWSEGEHAVRATAVDRSGNRTVRAWTFALPVAPPQPAPPVGTPTPDSTPPAVAEPVAALVAGSGDAVAATTGSRVVRLSLRPSTRRLRSGDNVQLRGQLSGGRAGRVHIEARVGGRWRAVVTVSVGQGGRFATPVRLPSPGVYLVRARAGKATSPTVQLTAQ